MERIEYSNLNSKQKEIYNFQKLSGILADYGFNCIKLADDWQGADFLAYHIDGITTLRVQLKGRVTIDKKYVDKDLHMAFPVSGIWYLIPHDILVRLSGEHCNWLRTDSWSSKGSYSSISANPRLLNSMATYRLDTQHAEQDAPDRHLAAE